MEGTKFHDSTAGVSDLDSRARQLWNDMLEKPIYADIPAETVARFYTEMNTRPRFKQLIAEAYNQLILRALRNAGAPVEGQLQLKLQRGRYAVVKDGDSPLARPGYMTYVWLSDSFVSAMEREHAVSVNQEV